MKKIKILIMLFTVSCFITSCGTNIFESFVDETEETDLSTLLDEAETEEDYNNIITEAETIINSASSSDTEREQLIKRNQKLLSEK